MTANKTRTTIYAIGILVLFALGVYLGFRWGKGPEPPPIDMHKIDSLNNVVLTLEDSLRSIQTKTETITKVIYKYKMRYDTISLRTDSREIVASLKRTAATPIK